MNWSIPEAEADTAFGGGGQRDFPTGIFKGEVGHVYLYEYHAPADDKRLIDKNGRWADYAVEASIRLDNSEPMTEESASPGNQKHFERVLLEYEINGQKHRWDEASEDDDFRLNITRRVLTNFSKALGLHESDGNGGVRPVSDFDELLRSTNEDSRQGLCGQEVSYEIIHDTRQKEGYRAKVKSFAPAI